MDFNQLHNNYYSEIYQFAFQLCMCKTESKDIAQDAFLRLFQEISNKSRLENPKAWLYKVVLNLYRNRYNKINGKHVKKYLFESRPNYSESPESNFINREKREFVFNCLNKLPEKNRDILILYHDGLSYSEISEVLDMNVNSVGQTLARSIKKLKLLLTTNHHELFEKE